MTRNEEEYKKLVEDLPVIRLVSGWEPIPDDLQPDAFEDRVRGRLSKLKDMFRMVESFKRTL